jgi:cytokine receptor domeless
VSEEFVLTSNNSSYIREKSDATINDNGTYGCRDLNTGMITNYVVKVGYPPLNVTWFNCTSENWEKLYCEMKLKENALIHDRKLFYGISPDTVENPCKLVGKRLNRSCTIEGKDYEIIKNQSVIYFRMDSNNSLGANTENFVIYQFKNMRPNKPENLQISAIDSRKVQLNWSLSENLNDFPGLIKFNIEVQSTCDPTWKKVDTKEIIKTKNNYSLTIDNLQYGNTNYTLRIGVYTNFTENDGNMHSDLKNKTFITLPRPPEKPPNIFEGSAFSNKKLYWEKVDKCLQNGQNFKYVVEYAGVRNEIDSEMIDVATLKNRTIKIWSKNEKGESKNYTTISIPLERLGTPRNVLLFDAGTANNITWEPPKKSSEKLTSYSIFWCESSKLEPDTCLSHLTYQKLSPGNTSYIVAKSDKKSFIYAISANYEQSSSGMEWAKCVQSNKLKSVEIHKNNTPKKTDEITVSWSVVCENLAVAHSYILEYCSVKSGCKNASTYSTKYTLGDLEAYTKYNMKIWIKTANGTVGPPVEFIQKTLRGLEL